MKIRHIWLLTKNEILHGPRDVILVMAVVLPLVLSFFINLAFGNIFSERPKVGVFDPGDSTLVKLLEEDSSLILKIYTSETQLYEATGRGSVDVGFILPVDFDQRVAEGSVDMTAYVWGESQAKNRTLIPALLAGAIRRMSGEELPVNIETISLGRETSQPWSSRLLPLTILMAVFFGGMMIPASSLINEKVHHTLEALNITPVSVGEIFAAKGILGLLLAAFMGILTLLVTGNINASFGPIVLILVLGGAMAAEIGLLSGALIKDMNTLFAIWKFGGMLLFGPAVIYMFPQIPQWIGYFFPTYYVIRPIVDLSINGAGLSDTLLYTGILIGLVIVLFILVNGLVQRLSTRALRV